MGWCSMIRKGLRCDETLLLSGVVLEGAMMRLTLICDVHGKYNTVQMKSTGTGENEMQRVEDFNSTRNSKSGA